MMAIDRVELAAGPYLLIHEWKQPFVIELRIGADHPIDAAIGSLDACRHSFADAKVAAVCMIRREVPWPPALIDFVLHPTSINSPTIVRSSTTGRASVRTVNAMTKPNMRAIVEPACLRIEASPLQLQIEAKYSASDGRAQNFRGIRGSGA